MYSHLEFQNPRHRRNFNIPPLPLPVSWSSRLYLSLYIILFHWWALSLRQLSEALDTVIVISGRPFSVFPSTFFVGGCWLPLFERRKETGNGETKTGEWHTTCDSNHGWLHRHLLYPLYSLNILKFPTKLFVFVKLILASQIPVSSVGVALSAKLGHHIHWANYLSLTCLQATFV